MPPSGTFRDPRPLRAKQLGLTVLHGGLTDAGSDSLVE